MPSARSINSFFILLLAANITIGCGEKAKQVVSNQPRKQVPEEAIDIVSYLSEAGIDRGNLEAKVKGRLTAPYMLRFQRADSPYAEFPRTLHVDFFKDSVGPKETPQIESQMDALYGKYLQNQEKVFLRDSVVVKNILKGDTVHCQELWWDAHSERFTTDKPVRINTKDKILYGTGMEADQNFRWYTIRHLTGTVLTAGNNIPK
jgi:LPS export ABC transporter protein LptC